jgi:predicted lipoprotein with Yx(FWY)xxD motif
LSKLPTVLILSSVALVVAGCGGSSKTASTSAPAAVPSTPSTATSAPASGGVKISTSTIAGIGPVLVNAQGHTLYTFAPDKDKNVTCVSACASIWPPAALPTGQQPVAVGLVKQSLLGSDPNPSGGQVITYAGWPLYTYVADTAPGQHSGQAVNLNGGLWYVISPAGKVITTKP